MIVSKEEEKVWQDTLKKLSRFGVKEEQVFKMSTTEVTELFCVVCFFMFCILTVKNHVFNSWSCADPESFAREGPTLVFCLLF